jgi:hypothetical protein
MLACGGASELPNYFEVVLGDFLFVMRDARQGSGHRTYVVNIHKYEKEVRRRFEYFFVFVFISTNSTDVITARYSTSK